MEPLKLGKYQIKKELGRGGFATVYRAVDMTLDREVAIKVLHPQLMTDPEFVMRFQKEAIALARLRHPHIVTVYEVIEVEQRLLIAMELGRGPSLKEWIETHNLIPWTQTLELLQPICEALDYAHSQKIVHRDLKPSNIVLDKERGPLLTDFGFARLMGDNSVSISLSGGVFGTPAYIAPEAWEMDVAETPADIYALGCIVYEMLTGKILFGSKTPIQSLRAHERGPRYPNVWPENVPEGILTVFNCALAHNPSKRYPSAKALWFALQDETTRKQRPVAEVIPRHREVKQTARQQHNIEAAKPKPHPDHWISPIDGKAMVRIPAGEFFYGSRNERKVLPEFWIDKTPVTNAEYKRFLDANPQYPMPGDWDRQNRTYPPHKANHPVIRVSWRDAAAYARWSGKRLPTEEEWEKATRGTDGRKYPWGDIAPDHTQCNFGRNEGDTTPVGTYSPYGDSPYGCVDMAGNVWEWTMGDQNTKSKVIRGGSWFNDWNYVNSTFQNRCSPLRMSYDVGFRCVIVSVQLTSSRSPHLLPV